MMVLNDDTREALDPATLEIGAGNVLYARVKGGKVSRALPAHGLLPSERPLRVRRRRPLLRANATGSSTSDRRVRLPPTPDESSRAESPYRPGSSRDSAEHRLDRAAGRGNQSAAAPGRAAGLLAGGSLSQSARAWITGRWWICARTEGLGRIHESRILIPRTRNRSSSRRTVRTSYLNAQYTRGDFLFFGGETKGLGKEFLSERTDRAYRIPIFEAGVRSLNLSNAVSIVVYEALRQTGALSSLLDAATAEPVLHPPFSPSAGGGPK